AAVASCVTSGEGRGAAFLEGGDAFGRFGGADGHRGQQQFVVEAAGGRSVAGPDSLQDAPGGQRPAGRDLPAEGFADSPQVLGRYLRYGQQPGGAGLGRAQPVAGQHDPQGGRPADGPREPLGPAGAGHQAEAGLGKAEGGVVGGDDERAGQGELEASAEGDAVDGGDDRYRQGGDPVEHRPAPGQDAVGGVGVPAGELVEVGTGRERFGPGA